jgi:hypothetical protein
MRTISEIERLRVLHRLTKVTLTQRADVNFETYRRSLKGITAPNSNTLEKLSDAVDQLIAEKEAAE